MTSFWHSNVLGRYSPEDKWIGLDFRKLFLDPTATRLTHVHELTHSLLSRTTDFGQATEVIIRALPQMKHINKQKREEIKALLRSSQIMIQEGSACIIELLQLKRLQGKQQALAWADKHFTDEYKHYFSPLLFLLGTSQYYLDSFTMRIPHLALHNAVRKMVVEKDLLSDPDRFIAYLKDPENNPDERFKKMVDVIRYQTFLPTRDPSEICKRTGITLFPNVSKKDAADFVNYVSSFTPFKTALTADQIRDASEVDSISEANEDIIIANMNLNLSEDAEVLWKKEDLLHYQQEVESILLTRVSRDLETEAIETLLLGNKLEAAIVAFLKTGEKYIWGGSTAQVSEVVTDHFSGKTLITKWGLYKPGQASLTTFDGSRRPDVVLYNKVSDLRGNFEQWFSEGNKATYLFLLVSQDHPFHILIVKDNDGVLHLVNTFAKPASDFLNDFSESLTKEKPDDFLNSARHYNNTLCVWGGMPWEVDWYATMLDGEDMIYRK